MTKSQQHAGAVPIPLAKIRTDGGTQSRVGLSVDTVNDYADAYQAGDPMPPVIVFHDGTDYWLADGFHRCAAARDAGFDKVMADVRQGTQRDAILFSVGANSVHGLRRTNDDKRRAVLMLLDDEEWGARAANWIAKQCAVSHTFVNRIKGDRAKDETFHAPETVTGQDGKEYPAHRPSGDDDTDPEAEQDPEPASEPVVHKCPRHGCMFDEGQQCQVCERHPEQEHVTVDIESAVMSLIAQRDQDPEFAAFRASQRQVLAALPSRAQKMVDFVLDGGELAMARLGVDWNVTNDELRRAHRIASAKVHPDRGGSHEDAVRVNAAYEIVRRMVG